MLLVLEAERFLDTTVYRSIAELPGNPELAVILTPARFVHDMLAQCGEKGTRWAVIESAGFRELGTQGEMLEREILKASKRFGLRFVGPNCVGTANTARRALHRICCFWDPIQER